MANARRQIEGAPGNLKTGLDPYSEKPSPSRETVPLKILWWKASLGRVLSLDQNLLHNVFWFGLQTHGALGRKIRTSEAESNKKSGVYCMRPCAGVEYNLNLCRLQSRLQHMYHGQHYARVDLRHSGKHLICHCLAFLFETVRQDWIDHGLVPLGKTFAVTSC